MKKKLQKIWELSDFNEIFSIDLSIYEFYYASVILFQKLKYFCCDKLIYNIHLKYKQQSFKFKMSLLDTNKIFFFITTLL